jgi:hypothetical protein
MQRSQRERPEQLEANAPLPDVTTIPVRARPSDARLAPALSLVAVLVALAILKPWGTGSPEATLRPIAVAAPTSVPITPAPTEDRSADGLAVPICLGTGGWRIASLERWRTQDVRVWRAIEPIASATGPLDPAIPSVPVGAIVFGGLGWCAPAFGPDRPVGPATVTAWSVRSGVAAGLQLRQVRPLDGSTPIAALYLPLTRCPESTNCLPLLPEPVPRPWDSGRIVFRYRDEGTGRVLWLAADVTILAADAAASSVPSGRP